MKTDVQKDSESDKVTVEISVSIPKRYIGFYNAISELGDIGSLDFIAEGGIIEYLNVLSDEIMKNGVSVIHPANPKILSSEKLNMVLVSISG